MKIWKRIKILTFFILILFLFFQLYDVIQCIKMHYPHPAMGIDVNTWIEQYLINIIFTLYWLGIPLILDIILLIISIVKTKKTNTID